MVADIEGRRSGGVIVICDCGECRFHCTLSGHFDCAVEDCGCVCHQGTYEMIIAVFEDVPSGDQFWTSGECDDLIEKIRKLREEAE